MGGKKQNNERLEKIESTKLLTQGKSHYLPRIKTASVFFWYLINKQKIHKQKLVLILL